MKESGPQTALGAEPRVLPSARAASQPPQMHAAVRWTQVVLSAMSCSSDPKTLHEWAKHANAAPSTLRSRCSAVKVSTKASLDFTRLLRALLHSKRLGYPPDLLLNGDPRTVHKLLAAGGLDRAKELGSIDDFLVRQTLVPDPLILETVRVGLDERGLA